MMKISPIYQTSKYEAFYILEYFAPKSVEFTYHGVLPGLAIINIILNHIKILIAKIANS